MSQDPEIPSAQFQMPDYLEEGVNVTSYYWPVKRRNSTYCHLSLEDKHGPVCVFDPPETAPI